MKKKILMSALIIFIIIIFTIKKENLKIGIFIYDQSDFYMINYVDYLYEELEEIGDIYIHDAKNSQILQNEAILEHIDRVDILIVNPVDRLSSYALIKLAKQKNKPIIFINREPLESDLAIYDTAYYVGSKAIQSAEYQAELIAELYGDDPENLNGIDRNHDNIIQLLIFKGQRGHQDAEDRTEYLQKFLIDSGYQLEVVDIKTADWNKQKAKQMMDEVLLDETYLEVIACNNDYMALGVVDAIQASGTSSTYYVLGIDGMEEALEAIEEGKMYGTVFNASKLQAEAVADLLKKEIFETDQEEKLKYIWIDYTRIINKDIEMNQPE